MRRQSDGFHLCEGESGEISSRKKLIQQELRGDVQEYASVVADARTQTKNNAGAVTVQFVLVCVCLRCGWGLFGLFILLFN